MIILLITFRPSANTSRARSSPSFPGIPPIPIPTSMLNSTAAGTTLLARDANGLAGIYNSTRSNTFGASIRLLLKNDADFTDGKCQWYHQQHSHTQQQHDAEHRNA